MAAVSDNTLVLVGTAAAVYLIYTRNQRLENQLYQIGNDLDYWLVERFPPRMRSIPQSMAWYGGYNAMRDAANNYEGQKGPFWFRT